MPKIHIIFISERITIRLYKQIKSISYNSNFEVSLFSMEYPNKYLARYLKNFYLFGKNISKYKLKLERTTGFGKESEKIISEINNFLKTIQFDLIHLHTPPNFPYDEIFSITKKNVFYDQYDPALFYGKTRIKSKKEFQSEKSLMENCSAIVTKFPDQLYKKYEKNNIKCIKKPRVLWVDYCDQDLVKKKPKRNLNLENISLIYGGVSSYPIIPNFFGGNNIYISSVKTLLNNGFKINLVSDIFNQNIKNKIFAKKYFDLEKRFQNLCLHGYLNQVDFNKLLFKSHFGLQLHNFKYTGHDKIFGETSFGNKFFSYLEAGLPIIVNKELIWNSEWVLKYNVGISVPIDEIDQIYSRIKYINYNKLLDNIYMLAVGELSLKHNSHKLTNFYEEW